MLTTKSFWYSLLGFLMIALGNIRFFPNYPMINFIVGIVSLAIGCMFFYRSCKEEARSDGNEAALKHPTSALIILCAIIVFEIVLFTKF